MTTLKPRRWLTHLHPNCHEQLLVGYGSSFKTANANPAPEPQDKEEQEMGPRDIDNVSWAFRYIFFKFSLRFHSTNKTF